jgi:hypothetical protein
MLCCPPSPQDTQSSAIRIFVLEHALRERQTSTPAWAVMSTPFWWLAPALLRVRAEPPTRGTLP